jgi:hypothetical protein
MEFPRNKSVRRFGLRRQSAATTALWIPDWALSGGRPPLDQVPKNQSGVALRFPPHSIDPASAQRFGRPLGSGWEMAARAYSAG